METFEMGPDTSLSTEALHWLHSTAFQGAPLPPLVQATEKSQMKTVPIPTLAETRRWLAHRTWK